MCAHWLFCTEFNAQQLLFEAFSYILLTFSSVKPQTEFNFSFQYILKFETNGQWRHKVPITLVVFLFTLSEPTCVSICLHQSSRSLSYLFVRCSVFPTAHFGITNWKSLGAIGTCYQRLKIIVIDNWELPSIIEDLSLTIENC